MTLCLLTNSRHLSRPSLFAPRFSLRSLLCAVAFIAVALASLMQPWRSWCPSLVLTVTLFLLLVAIPASFLASGRERAFYVGFAVVGWGYFLLAYAPALDVSVGRQLLATPIAESVCFAVTGSLGDIQPFLKITHTLFTFALACAGGIVTGRCYMRAGNPSAMSTRREHQPLNSHELSLRRAP